MNNRTPLGLIIALIQARSDRDVDAAVACYEADATVVMEPDRIERGTSSIRAFTEAAVALPITFSDRRIVDGTDVALHLCKWQLQISPPGEPLQKMDGCSADVLRKQADGTWLIAIDNAWGASQI
jgi:uncharacterized protein (TIGR02246 family)